MNQYQNRIKTKFCKYINSKGLLFAVLLIIKYISRDLTTFLLTCFIKLLNSKKEIKNGGKILFIEPFQQGYGDLIFQTPIFETLSNKGYYISLLLNKNHLPIIKSNPFIYKTYTRNSIKNIFEILFTKFDTVFLLMRDTIPETLLGLLKIQSNLIMMDGDIKYWNNIFSKNHTEAWQLIVKKYFQSDLIFNKPKIYLTKNNKNIKPKICIIAGIEKKEKSIGNIKELIDFLNLDKTMEIVLIGKDKDWSKNPEIENDLVNKRTYEESLMEMTRSSLVIGPEGSLTHASTTLEIPTIILENENRPFWKYSGLSKNKNIITIDEKTKINEIASIVRNILSR